MIVAWSRVVPVEMTVRVGQDHDRLGGRANRT